MGEIAGGDCIFILSLLKINGQSLKIKAPRNYGGCYVCRGHAVQMVDE